LLEDRGLPPKLPLPSSKCVTSYLELLDFFATSSPIIESLKTPLSLRLLKRFLSVAKNGATQGCCDSRFLNDYALFLQNEPLAIYAFSKTAPAQLNYAIDIESNYQIGATQDFYAPLIS
ncbi:unnamed protein product, partial [Ilex paraguariensis]